MAMVWRILVAVLVWGGAARGAVFSDEAALLAALGTRVTDTYSAATYGYVAGNTVRLTDAAMSAAFGQTEYSVPSLNNANLVGKLANLVGYCAGCNADFGLGFGGTSVTVGGGVYGFGFYYETFNATAQTGVVRFGNGTTATVTLPGSANPVPSYFGEVSALQILSFTMTSASPYLVIADLTIGAAPVPEPGSLVMLAAWVAWVVAGGGVARWWRRRAAKPRAGAAQVV